MTRPFALRPRAVLAVLGALCPLARTAPGQIPTSAPPRDFVTPQFGARADDAGDDTRAFQAAVDAAAAAGRGVRVPPGTYRIDGNANPRAGDWGPFGGVRLPSRSHFRLDAGAVLQAIPTAAAHYAVLRVDDVDDVVIEGPGTIRGERHAHRGSQGEWGMGIFVRGGRRVRIDGVRIEDCWGDGILLYRSERRYTEDVEVVGVRLDGNRRQGISVVSARRVLIADADIRDTHGTWPSAGIDLEPDDRNSPNEDVTIRGGYFAGNEQDILMVWGNRNVTVDGPTLRSKNGVVVRDGSRGVRIVGADIHAAGTAGGTAAIQLDAVDPSTIDGVEISGNTLRGGAVVLDVPHEQTRGVRVLNNRIQRDRADQTPYRLRARGARWSGNRVRE